MDIWIRAALEKTQYGAFNVPERKERVWREIVEKLAAERAAPQLLDFQNIVKGRKRK